MKITIKIKLIQVFIGLAAAAILLTSCQPSTPAPTPMGYNPGTPTSEQPIESETGSAHQTSTPVNPPTGIVPDSPITIAYTYQQPDGNRWLEGSGDIRNATPLDIALPGSPRWLVAAPFQNGSLWAAVLEDGSVLAFLVTGSGAQSIPITPSMLSPGAPPLLLIKGDVPTLLTAPDSTTSEITHPVWLPQSGSMAFIDSGGDLVFWRNGEVARLAVGALPDARLLVDEQDRILLYTNPTDRYPHGVLGDAIEAGSVTLINTLPAPVISMTIPFAPQVAEGIAPIWVDLDSDGAREIIVTLSDDTQGAQIVIYAENGTRMAASTPIGRGFRWRHLLAAAPFAPNGEIELVDVVTPHIGGIVEFLTLSGKNLETTTTINGYSSHTIGSRNLDTVIAGDFDADGIPELLLPDQAMSSLGIVKRTTLGAEVIGTLTTGSRITTNLAGVNLEAEGIGIGVGLENNTIRIWLSGPAEIEN
jgi:hypothetical protein